MHLGKHFTLDELTHSQTAQRRGLSNSPDASAVGWLQRLVVTALDPIREALGRPVSISSGYRSPAVNKAVGGASSSQHVLGQAADIRTNAMTPAQLVAFIRTLGLPFDQLIEEPTWVHISVGPRNRRQVLRARRTVTGMKYEEIP
jgi:uncharacterized protein YcbK (DUF882 family)